jgi:hypothetical protein
MRNSTPSSAVNESAILNRQVFHGKSSSYGITKSNHSSDVSWAEMEDICCGGRAGQRWAFEGLESRGRAFELGAISKGGCHHHNKQHKHVLVDKLPGYVVSPVTHQKGFAFILKGLK